MVARLQVGLFFRRCYTTATTSTTPVPPMLLKIRKDMKTAMQAKDKDRLSVLKSLMAQTLNASKTSSPIVSDIQMLALIRKTAQASRTACMEFQDAGRQDLAEKEESQLKIMAEYAKGVETVSDEEIEAAVNKAVHHLDGMESKSQLGDVLKRVFAPDLLGGKPVERSEVVKIVKQVLHPASGSRE